MLKQYKNSRIECAKVVENLADTFPNLIHITSDGNDYVKRHPNRSFDVGIAEANLINVATGFALKGKPVIVNAITSFMLYNAYLQIRSNLCYQNLKVILLGVGGGFSYGHLGFSHHSLEDIAVMRTLPNMKIYLPADAFEASYALKDAMKRDGPSYIRIRSGSEPILTSKIQTPISFDHPYSLRHGKDVLIFTYGASLTQSLLAAKELSKVKIGVEIINVNSLNIYKPYELLSMIKNHKLIVTIDEHFVTSGLGSVINSTFYGKTFLPIINLGVKRDFFSFGGTSTELEKYVGLDSNSIQDKILTSLKTITNI